MTADGQHWRFDLREDVTFHNGDRFDSEAAKYSIDRMADPDMGDTLGASGVYAQYLADATVTAEDAYTLEIELGEPTADLLDILTEGYIVHPESLDSGWNESELPPCGTGPFRFVEWSPDEALTVRANESYFGGAPDVDEVVWQVIPDADERVARLRSGDIDIATGVEPTQVASIEQTSTADVVSVRNPTCIIYLFNCTEGPFEEPAMRKAANLAVETDEIIETILDGAGEPLSGFISPHHFGFDLDVSAYEYDPDRAAELVSEAGWTDGPPIQLLTPVSLPDEAVELSGIVAESLEAIGCEVELTQIEDREAYANMVRRSEIGDICCFDSSPLSTYRVLREKISSVDEGAWWQGYENPEVDALLEQASRTPETSERESLYRDCFRLLHEDPPWLYLYNPRNNIGVSRAYEGWRPRADGCAIPG